MGQRAIKSDLKKIDDWLIEQAQAKARTRGEEPLVIMSLKQNQKLTNAERDLLNIYLLETP